MEKYFGYGQAMVAGKAGEGSILYDLPLKLWTNACTASCLRDGASFLSHSALSALRTRRHSVFSREVSREHSYARSVCRGTA